MIDTYKLRDNKGGKRSNALKNYNQEILLMIA